MFLFIMKIEKTWAMANAKTFTIEPIRIFVETALMGKAVIIDPFANSCKYGTITNDINPKYATDYHLDALTFLAQFRDNYADVVLFDPPYSITQAAEHYNQLGKDKLSISVANMKYWSLCKDHVARITKPNGIVLCFGWNTNGLGKNRGFEMTDILIVSHGGSRNDTLCTREFKIQPTLF